MARRNSPALSLYLSFPLLLAVGPLAKANVIKLKGEFQIRDIWEPDFLFYCAQTFLTPEMPTSRLFVLLPFKDLHPNTVNIFILYA